MNEQIPKGAIPIDQFQEASPSLKIPEGAIPIDQFEDYTDKYSSTSEQIKAGIENVASSGTLGLSTGLERVLDVKPEDIRGRSAAHEIAHPTLYGAEKLAGFVGSAFVPGLGEANLVGDVGKGATYLAGAGEGLSASAVRGAAQMGAETALMQGGDEVSKYFSQDPEQTAETAISNIGLSGLIGAGIGAPLGSISPLWKATKETALGKSLESVKDTALNGGMGGFTKKLLSSLGGVSEENIDKYIADREAINASPEFREIYDSYLPKIEEIHHAVADKKLSVDEAKSALSEVSRSFKDDLKQKGFEANVSDQMAKQGLKTAQTQFAQDLQESAFNAAPNVVSAVENLRQKVVEGSREAYSVLEASGEKIPLGNFYNKSKELIENLRSSATLEDKAMADRLESYVDNVKEQYGKKWQDGSTIKSMIQGLDRNSTYDFNATSFDKGLSRNYKQLRYILDDDLKEYVPAYREAMKPLAEDTGLLKSLNKYGDEFSATKKISTLKSAANIKNELPLLEQLQQKSGVDFLNSIKQYADKDARAALMKKLPEYADSLKTADAIRMIKNPETMRKIESMIAETQEFKAHQLAQQEFELALSQKEELGGINPNNLESKLKAAMRGKLNVEKAIAGLPKLEGKNLSEVLENLKVKESLEGGHTNGSKNVNLYGGLLGGAAGMLGGHVLGGIAGGAAMGSFMDKYGHSVVKKVLDFYLDHHGDIPKIVGESNKNAVRLALAKMLDHGQEISTDSFKGMVHLISASIKGEKELSSAAKNVFSSNHSDVKPLSKDELNKVDKKIKELSENPSDLLKIGGKIGHYLPDHSTVMAKTAASAVNYLNVGRPKSIKINPLDKPTPIDKAAQEKYNRSLEIAERPLIILNHVKKGTLQASDIQTLNAIYPGLQKKIVKDLSEQMILAVHDGKTIPYHQKVSLGLLMGQPLDSTNSQATMLSIISSNGKTGSPQQQMVHQSNRRPTSAALNASQKVNSMYLTPLQAREAHRTK